MAELTRTSTVDELAEVLGAEILAGEYSPGARLLEEELSQRYGVSRNTFREALQRLDWRGLVDRRPHRGAMVAQPTGAEVREIFAVRLALEPVALGALDAAGLERLADVAAAMEDSAAGEDWPGVAECDGRFHAGIVAAIGSERLNGFFRSLLHTLRLAFVAVDRTSAPGVPAAHVAEHRAIVDARAAGQVEEARALLTRHVREARTRVLDVIREV